jgi:hypothetical protein
VFTADQARRNVEEYRKNESLQKAENTKIYIAETLKRIEASSNKGETSIIAVHSGLIAGETFRSAMKELGFSVALTRFGYKVCW